MQGLWGMLVDLRYLRCEASINQNWLVYTKLLISSILFSLMKNVILFIVMFLYRFSGLVWLWMWSWTVMESWRSGRVRCISLFHIIKNLFEMKIVKNTCPTQIYFIPSKSKPTTQTYVAGPVQQSLADQICCTELHPLASLHYTQSRQSSLLFPGLMLLHWNLDWA